MPKRRSLALLLGAALAAAAACGPPPPEPKLSTIRAQIFEPRCSAGSCHGSGAAGNLDLTEDPHAALVDVASSADPALKRVVPGDPESSLLYQVLIGESDVVEPMPRGLPARSLPEEDIELVRAWIEAGAKDD